MTTIDARCPHCQARFVLPAGQAGKPARCGRCQGVFTPELPRPVTPVRAAPALPPRPVLNAVPVAAPSLPPPRRRVEEDDDEPRRERKRRPARRSAPAKSRGMSPVLLGGLLIGGGVILIGVVGLVAYLASRPGDGPADPTNQAVAAAGRDTGTPFANPPAGGSRGGASESAADTVRRVKASTVYIRVTLKSGQMASGSGFFAGKAGYVVTNAHVIGLGTKEKFGVQKVQVVVESGEARERTYDARLIGFDAEDDLALLWVPGQDLPAPLPFGRAADLMETQELVIYGYPLGELLGREITVTPTTVSSLRKENGAIAVVQVAGGMHPGNSGGPVTNKSGEVIGVSVAGIRGTQINFAIPAETADRFVRDQIASGGKMNWGSRGGPTPPGPGRR